MGCGQVEKGRPLPVGGHATGSPRRTAATNHVIAAERSGTLRSAAACPLEAVVIDCSHGRVASFGRRWILSAPAVMACSADLSGA